MKIIECPNGVYIKVFTSGKEMTSARYSEYQRYLALDASMDKLMFRLERTKAFIQEKDYESAEIEANNSITCLNSALSGISYTSMAFAVLVAEIGGKVPKKRFSIPFVNHPTVCDDITEDGLKRVIQRVNELQVNYGVIQDEVSEFKKKVEDELESLFPNFRDTTQDLIVYSNMKDFIISTQYTDFNDEWEVEQLLKKQNLVTISGGVVKSNSNEIDANFYALCGLMEENGSSNPHQYNVIQFYSKLDYINKKIEKENSASNG